MKDLIVRQYVISIVGTALFMILIVNVASIVNRTDMKSQVFFLSIVAFIIMAIFVALINALNFLFNERTRQFRVSFELPIVIWSIIIGIGIFTYLFSHDEDLTGNYFSVSAMVPLIVNIWTIRILKQRLIGK